MLQPDVRASGSTSAAQRMRPDLAPMFTGAVYQAVKDTQVRAEAHVPPHDSVDVVFPLTCTSSMHSAMLSAVVLLCTASEAIALSKGGHLRDVEPHLPAPSPLLDCALYTQVRVTQRVQHRQTDTLLHRRSLFRAITSSRKLKSIYHIRLGCGSNIRFTLQLRSNQV